MARTLFSFLVAAGLAFGLAGCGGMSSPKPTFGYAPNEGTLSYGGNGQKKRFAKEGAAKQRFASIADRAPRGSYDKAPQGAFDGRDYTHTHLDPETARKMINTYRASKGLTALRLNEQLAEAAKIHARDLAEHDRISHYGSDGSDPLVRVERTGYPVHLAAENVGTGQISLAEVVSGWQKSPGHNANLLLKEAREMGIALVVDPNTEYKTFWTLVLGTKRTSGS